MGKQNPNNLSYRDTPEWKLAKEEAGKAPKAARKALNLNKDTFADQLYEALRASPDRAIETVLQETRVDLEQRAFTRRNQLGETLEKPDVRIGGEMYLPRPRQGILEKKQDAA